MPSDPCIKSKINTKELEFFFLNIFFWPMVRQRTSVERRNLGTIDQQLRCSRLLFGFRSLTSQSCDKGRMNVPKSEYMTFSRRRRLRCRVVSLVLLVAHSIFSAAKTPLLATSSFAARSCQSSRACACLASKDKGGDPQHHRCVHWLLRFLLS